MGNKQSGGLLDEDIGLVIFGDQSGRCLVILQNNAAAGNWLPECHADGTGYEGYLVCEYRLAFPIKMIVLLALINIKHALNCVGTESHDHIDHHYLDENHSLRRNRTTPVRGSSISGKSPAAYHREH